MSDRNARIGVVMLGCGWASTIHSRTLRRLPGVQVFYASRQRARADAQCSRFGGVAAFGSYEEALADPRVDVALVVTPTATHRELALAALSAGKHVIVEKPAFMRAADADVVRETAARSQRRVFVAENYFYKPVAAHLRRTIAAGDIGDVRFVLLNATKRQNVSGWRTDAALSGGGALFEAGIHWISFASNIGLEVAHVSGFRVGTMEGPDRSSIVLFRYANGAAGTLAHSWELKAPLGGMRLSKVQGTLGAVTFESNGTVFLTTGRRRSLQFALTDTVGYRAMMLDFIGALRTGAREQFTLDLAQRDLRFLERIDLDGVMAPGASPRGGQHPTAGPQNAIREPSLL